MSYIALYRKWRPKTFEDVVGQEHITTTLKNQILFNRIAHAYLFSGTRGTGKTSTAKIFARAVNCPHHIQGDPCHQCEVCKEIESSGVMDIIEIDAASNRGVDEIRDLRERVKYPPSLGRYKVYIIDEVHMLTQEAFNALLKTLEEPPKHVIFILATTEPHKLPATILSRCQRFDFKRVTLKDMVGRMEYICREMDISIEEKALELIAKNAEGAMRDALSILDQCLSLVEENQTITYENITDTLGLASESWVYDIAGSILKQDIRNTLSLLHEMMDNGKDILQMVKQLREHFRNLLMVKTLSQAENILEMTAEQIESLKNQGEEIIEERLFRFIDHLNQVENKMKTTSQPVIILEMELINLCKQPKGESLESLLERISILEKKIQDGMVTQASPSPRVTPTPTPPPPSRPKVQPTPSPTRTSVPPQGEEQETLQRNDSLTKENIQEKWGDILREVRKRKVSVEALLKEGQLAQYDKGKLLLGFKEGFGFHQTALSRKDNLGLLQQVISQVMNSAIKVECVMMDQITFSGQEEVDIVDKTIEIFGEDVVEIVEEK
ncbi:DNA polymerase III subunit gamma/tau [Irregularibacter muris]|uniref:DNA-directed DNA polymerase n=1 Tax=Irregularibacter muris TaxID=1796619 RepID=A0AAE3HJE4_9FIRM|nr:DNA polymerase III subunit gamma/tau [Irregularibacter muris]